MKRFITVAASLVAVFLSSCTVFVFNEDEHSKKDSKDSMSIVITHNVDGSQRK